MRHSNTEGDAAGAAAASQNLRRRLMEIPSPVAVAKQKRSSAAESVAAGAEAVA